MEKARKNAPWPGGFGQRGGVAGSDTPGGEEGFEFEDAGDGFGVFDLAREDHVEGFVEGDALGGEELVGVEVHGGGVQPAGGPDVDDLGVVADGGVDFAQGDVLVGADAALFGQLPFGGFKGVLAGFQLAGGQLPQLLLHGVAELPHHADGPVLVVRQDAGAAVVVDHVPQGGGAVLQQGGVPGDGDDPALVYGLALERFFKMRFHTGPLSVHSRRLLPTARRAGPSTGGKQVETVEKQLRGFFPPSVYPPAGGLSTVRGAMGAPFGPKRQNQRELHGEKIKTAQKFK